MEKVFRAVYAPMVGLAGRLCYVLVPHTGCRSDDLNEARRRLGLEDEINRNDFMDGCKTKKVVFKV